MLKFKKYMLVALALLLPSITLADLTGVTETMGTTADLAVTSLAIPVVGVETTQNEDSTTHVVATVNGQVVYDSDNADNGAEGSMLNQHIGPLPSTGPLLGTPLNTGLLSVGGIGGSMLNQQMGPLRGTSLNAGFPGFGGGGGLGGIGGVGGVGGLGGIGGMPIGMRLMLGTL